MTDPAVKKTRVALYLRVSSDEQREKETIKTQEDALRRFAEMTDVEVFDWYKDDGISGTIPMAKRPEGARLLHDAALGCFDEVVVFKIDRLGRDDLDPIIVWKQLEGLSVSVRSVTEGVSRIFDYHIRVAMGAEERRALLERSKAGMDRAAREGRYCGGIVPLGFMAEGKKPNVRLVPSDKVIWNDWTEAELVRQIYRWVAFNGWSCVRVADHLNALGVPTVYTKDERLLRDATGRRTKRTENIWRPGRIRNLLVNPVYKGDYLYGRRSKKPRDLIPSKVPAIVEPAPWEAAQAQLAANRRVARRGTRVNLLRSLATCNHCRLTYCAYEGNRGVIWYRCGGQMKYRSKAKGYVGKCWSRSFRADFLEPIVTADVTRWLCDPNDGLIEELRAERSEPAAAVDEAERTLIEKALAGMAGKRARLLEARMADLITLEEFQTKVNELKEQESGLVNQLNEMEVHHEPAPAPLDEDLVAEIRARVLGGSLGREDWREIIALLVDRIDADTEKLTDDRKSLRITIHYRFPRVDETCRGRGSWRR